MHEKIMERYKDELKDVAMYVEFYKVAENDTQKCIFRDIAKEEYQHACALKHLLEKAGMKQINDDGLEIKAKESLETI